LSSLSNLGISSFNGVLAWEFVPEDKSSFKALTETESSSLIVKDGGANPFYSNFLNSWMLLRGFFLSPLSSAVS
jgi:hypothetical protein